MYHIKIGQWGNRHLFFYKIDCFPDIEPYTRMSDEHQFNRWKMPLYRLRYLEANTVEWMALSIETKLSCTWVQDCYVVFHSYEKYKEKKLNCWLIFISFISLFTFLFLFIFNMYFSWKHKFLWYNTCKYLENLICFLLKKGCGCFEISKAAFYQTDSQSIKTLLQNS